MYAVGDTLPAEQLDAGALLVSGPAMTGKYELILDLLIAGFEHDEGALIVTTNRGATTILEDIESGVGYRPEQLRFVDCVSERQGGNERLPEDMTEYVSSPADLTGIGIGVSEQLKALGNQNVAGTRVGFHSLSTLLMYAELETVFRFLHVLTGRVASIDGLGLFAIDPTTHEEGTINTLKQLFDGMIELRDNDGQREVRFVGIEGASNEWTSY